MDFQETLLRFTPGQVAVAVVAFGGLVYSSRHFRKLALAGACTLAIWLYVSATQQLCTTFATATGGCLDREIVPPTSRMVEEPAPAMEPAVERTVRTEPISMALPPPAQPALELVPVPRPRPRI